MVVGGALSQAELEVELWIREGLVMLVSGGGGEATIRSETIYHVF